VQIQHGKIRVLGDGVINVRLQYGSDSDVESDNGLVIYDAFPFKFDMALDANLDLVEMNQLEIDAASLRE
jgi:hypothetical protein